MTNEENVGAGEEEWHAHALAIGKLVLAWNDFQEKLAELYATLFEQHDFYLALASWQALENDRSQREMLRSVAKVRFGNDSKEYKEINWIVENANQKLSNQRNFGIHTPFMTLISWDLKSAQVLPQTLLGNRRANGLSEKEVLKEFQIYERQLVEMGWFIYRIMVCIRPRNAAEVQPWPERPALNLK